MPSSPARTRRRSISARCSRPWSAWCATPRRPGGPKIELDISAAEPEAYFVLGHDSRLGQVFNNLIDNARSFCRKDGTVRVGSGR